MINYSYYPILNNGIRIKELDEQSILYARDNIEKYKPTKTLDIDIPVWLISTIILHNLKNNLLIRKFVTNYGKLFESRFSTDIKDKTVRKSVLYHLNVFNDLKVVDKNRIALHMNDYLEIALCISERYPSFLLTNSDLEKGFVHLYTPGFVYLCRLVIESKLYDKIKTGMKDYTENELINQVVKELGGRYPVEEKRISSKNDTVPESIQALIDKAYKEHELTHRERIKVGIAMQAQGHDIEEIVDVFRQCSDFSEKTTRYQLRSLRKYIKPT